MTTNFNTEMNKQIRELTTTVEMEAVSGGCPLIAAGLILIGGELGFLAGEVQPLTGRGQPRGVTGDLASDPRFAPYLDKL